MENVACLMTSRLADSTLAAARKVGAAAENCGVRPFLVGGTVRDLLIDRPETFDIDIALVGANAETFDRIAARTGGTVSRRSLFTTAKLRLDDLEIDMAMARAEEYPTSGSLPVVRSGALAEDLARRDFSVNAMAVSLRSDGWGDLVDLHCGLADLEQHRLRVLSEGSFRDDATRILRAARYSSRLDLMPTPETLDAIMSSLGFIDELSPARVRNELERVFVEPDPEGAIRLLRHWGGLGAIHSSLEHHADAWGQFAVETGDMPRRDRIEAGYAVLAHGLSESDASGVVARLSPDAFARRVIRDSAMLGRMPASELAACSNSSLAGVLDPMARSAVLGASLANVGDLRHRLSAYLREQRHLRPCLTGNDLMAMSVPEGPGVGRILEMLRNAWLDGEISSPDAETALAEKLIAQFAES